MEDLCFRTLLTEKIKIEPKYLTKQVKQEILKRLTHKVEGICSKHGYIRKGSIEISKILSGVVEILSLNGYVNYTVHFYADVCNPLIGTVIKNAKVVNMNRFGILAEAKIIEDKFANSILEIIIAKNSVNIISEVNLDTIKIGDEINVEVIGKKYNLGDKKISVIGKIIKEIKPRYLSKTKQDIDEEDVDEEPADIPSVFEEEEEEVEIEEEEEEEEEEEKAGGSDFFSDDVDEFEIDEVSEPSDAESEGI